jgi:hypothetical protein
MLHRVQDQVEDARCSRSWSPSTTAGVCGLKSMRVPVHHVRMPRRQLDHTRPPPRQIDARPPPHLDPAELHELAQQPAQPLRLRRTRSAQHLTVLTAQPVTRQLLDCAADRRQRILDLVRQRRAQLRHRLQPLRAPHQVLDLATLRDVLDHRRHPRRAVTVQHRRAHSQVPVARRLRFRISNRLTGQTRLRRTPHQRAQARRAPIQLLRRRLPDPVAAQLQQLRRRPVHVAQP